MKPVLLALTSLLLSALAGGAGAADTCLADTSQADFQAAGTIPTNIDTASSPGNVTLAVTTGGGASLDAQNTSITANGEKVGKHANNTVNAGHWVAQTFKPLKSGSLSRVDLNMFCFCTAAPPPSMVVSLRATSAGMPAASDLASTTLTITDRSGGQGWYSANFATPATVTAGTQYAIVIRVSAAYSMGTIAFSDSAIDGTHGNDVYAGGTLDFSTNAGSSWTVEGQQSGGAAPSVDGGFRTYIGGTASGYASAGDLVSSTKDSNPGTGTPNWTTLSWTNAQPAGTSLSFQAAGSSNSTGPFNFVGPDGTSGTYFTASGASLSRFNGNRYLKYRAYLTGGGSVTPTLNDATTCYNNVANVSNADLSITNTDGATTATPGNKVIYTVTAANAAGSSTVTGATVTDTFQQPLINCSFTCVGSNGGTCPSSGIGNINSPVTLPGGASATFTATCSLPSSATGSLVNTASIAAPAGINDTNPDNNHATDTESLTPTADLSITNTDTVGGATPGSTITYTIRAANAGPSDVTGAHVTDQFPGALSCNWTCTGGNGGSCAASGSGSIDATVNLPKSANVLYSATCKISSAATGTVNNTAAIAMPAGAIDPATGNNSATDSDPLTVRADAVVTMDDGVTSVQVGDAVDYLIQVTNAGPSDISVTVNDALPAQLSNGSWVCSATGGASCAKSSGNNNTMNTSATVPVGGKATYIYTATLVIDNNVDAFTNVVSIAAPSGADPNGGNNVVRDSNTVVVYQSGFEPDPQSLTTTNVAVASGAGDSFAVQMGVDAGLLNHLGSRPVTIASGRSKEGKKLFSVQLARLGNDIAMRTLTRAGDGRSSDVASWRIIDLKQHVLNLDWQSASAHGNDGYLNVAAGNSQMSPSAHNVKESATQLQIAVENDIPWLVPIEP